MIFCLDKALPNVVSHRLWFPLITPGGHNKEISYTIAIFPIYLITNNDVMH